MPQAYGVSLNNPGDLTVFGPGSILYPGQSGTWSGPTFTYASFPDPTTGWNALVNYIQRHINSGWTTLAQFVNNFGGFKGNLSPGTPGGNYLAAVSQFSGIAPNAVINPSEANAIAIGIAHGEGTTSLIPLAYRPEGRAPEGVSVHRPGADPSPQAALADGQITSRVMPASAASLGSTARRVQTGSEIAPPATQAPAGTWFSKLKRGFRGASKAPKGSASASASEQSASSSLSSELRQSPSQIAAAGRPQARPNPTAPAAGSNNGGSQMSEVSKFIEAHTNWLNVFLPTLKNIIDVLPVPPPIKADFDMAYSMAPGVIMAGAAAVQAAGGGQQVALNDLAGAFSGGQPPAAPAPAAPAPAPVVAAPMVPAPVVVATAPAQPPAAPAPAPAPVVTAPAAAPGTPAAQGAPPAGSGAQTPAQLPGLVTAAPAPNDPATVPPPVSLAPPTPDQRSVAPGTAPATAPLTPAELSAGVVSAHDLSVIASALGLKITDANGNPVS